LEFGINVVPQNGAFVPFAFERLWQETGCRRVIGELAGEREFQFDLERAVFLTVLHRLFDPGSDRAADKWRHGLVINGVGDLELHQLYRAMGWLGDELADQSGRGLAPRTTKDCVEERLFALRNNLFSELCGGSGFLDSGIS
jgi:hypothetical protein